MIKSSIKVSIISPIYNTPQSMLRNNIEHLISQSMKDIEIILVDDGSNKETALICDEYAEKDNRITVIHQENKGLCGARNSGQKAAKGEYIAFVDGDDYLEYDAIESMYANTKSGKIDIVFACIIKDYGNKTREFDYSQFIDGKVYSGEECQYLQEKVLDFTANASTTGAKLYKKAFLDDNHIMHKEYLRQGAEGLEFMIRVFGKAENVLFMKKVVQHYMYNDKSITEKHNEENHSRILLCFEEIENEIKQNKNYDDLHKELLCRLQYVIVTTAISGYFSPLNKESFWHAKKKFYHFLYEHKVLIDSLHRSGRQLDRLRRVILLLIKMRFCLPIKMLGFIRKKQKRSFA